MAKEDQEMRKKWFIDESWDEMVNAKNTSRMKEIVTQIGWPTLSKVGSEASHNAWLLIQHSDKDVEFQELCLGLMKSESTEEVKLSDIAYLEDRVRVNKKLPQLYGTQMRVVDGQRLPQPIENPDDINIRRQEMGLAPIEEYIKFFYEKYGEPDESEK